MINDWKATALGAWSMWAFYVLILLEAVPEVIGSLAPEMQPSDGVMTSLSIVAVACGAVARLLAQPKLDGQQ
jgi:hypothetical protein